MFQLPLSRTKAHSCTEQTSPYYRIKEPVKFGCGTNWKIFGTAKPHGLSVQRMVRDGWISVRRRY